MGLFILSDMESCDYYIDFNIDDDWDDTECPLTADELQAMGISVDRRDIFDDGIIWN